MNFWWTPDELPMNHESVFIYWIGLVAWHAAGRKSQPSQPCKTSLLQCLELGHPALSGSGEVKRGSIIVFQNATGTCFLLWNQTSQGMDRQSLVIKVTSLECHLSLVILQRSCNILESGCTAPCTSLLGVQAMSWLRRSINGFVLLSLVHSGKLDLLLAWAVMVPWRYRHQTKNLNFL